MAPVAQPPLGCSRAIIVHPQHYASQQIREAQFAAARRRRSRSATKTTKRRDVAKPQDLPPEAWAVVASHVESGVELGKLCMVSRAAHRGTGQEHWKQLCVRVWSIDATQWSGATDKRSSSWRMSDQRCCECASCQVHSANTKLKRCARCKAVFYCSVQCQRRSWASHRTCCSTASSTTAPSCWRKLYRYNYELLRNTFLDPALDRTLQQAYPRISSFSI